MDVRDLQPLLTCVRMAVPDGLKMAHRVSY